MKKKKHRLLLLFAVIVAVAVYAYLNRQPEPSYSKSVQDVPPFSGEPYVVINDNKPEFTEDDLTTEAYELYSELDRLGRCGYAMACVGRELMPTEDRGNIGQVKPSGWQTSKYDFVDGKYLYNRCHLIGFQLTGENANEKNLITGTRFLNLEGMLPFENMIADYIKETNNHVLYRVTPIFDGENLVARGVQMEALSVEDAGEEICFHVYVYNNQPGVIIDYKTGENRVDESVVKNGQSGEYILNTNSKKFHTSDCQQASSINDGNKQTYSGSRELLIIQGYAPGSCCKP